MCVLCFVAVSFFVFYCICVVFLEFDFFCCSCFFVVFRCCYFSLFVFVFLLCCILCFWFYICFCFFLFSEIYGCCHRGLLGCWCWWPWLSSGCCLRRCIRIRFVPPLAHAVMGTSSCIVQLCFCCWCCCPSKFEKVINQ